MANNPKKAQDPTEAALSAIQEALSMRGSDDAPDAALPDDHAPESDDFNSPQRDMRPLLPPDDELPRQLRTDDYSQAANDDRETIGQVLQALQRQPPRTPYIVAALFSVAWAISAIGLLIGYWSAFQGMLAQAGTAVPLAVALLAGFAMPVVFFFVLAHMVARSHELRYVAHAMARAAVRFAEPENVAYRDSLGWALYRLNRLEAAEEAVRTALESDGNNAVILDRRHAFVQKAHL